jgi:hypothetical protein
MAMTNLPYTAFVSSALARTGSVEHALDPGTKVEVRRRFDNRWARGFEVVAAEPDGYRVRRLSDGEEIPVPFSPDVVRRQSSNNWWY